MSIEDLATMGIRAVSDLLRAGTISPVEIVAACLSRIERLNPGLNAFITVLAEEARAQAVNAEAEIHAGKWRGPLHGIPVAIKDFYDTAGIRTTAAFERFADRVPRKDAVAVAKLRAAGAIVLGKTNMHRLGMGTTGLDSHFGPVRNPWNADHIPGGSSSGSAAAVAAGLCYATLDTDAIGSCRLPAACCGVVGFKPSYGLISSQGILAGEPADQAILWLSHAGLTTRRVEDTVILLEVLAEPGKRMGPDRRHEPIRVGFASAPIADRDVAAAFEAARGVIRSLGHALVAADVPFDTPRFGDVGSIEEDRRRIARAGFGETDLVLLPTIPTTVPTVAQARSDTQALSAANTLFANYFGLPAISVPCGLDPRGLPIGLQMVARPGGDDQVLELARQYLDAAGTVAIPRTELPPAPHW